MHWKALVPSRLDHRVRFLPVAVLNVISTCDSKCVACDYWRLADGPRLGRERIEKLVPELKRLGTRQLLLSGGEPLVHPDLPDLAALLHREGFEVLLHTNAVRLKERLPEIGPHVSHVFVSIDGASPEAYRRMRGVDALESVLAGIREAKREFPRLRVGSRTVLMRGNLDQLQAIVELGLREGLAPISFLGADVQSEAFGRDRGSESPGLEVLAKAGLAKRLPSEEELRGLASGIRGLEARFGGAAETRIEGGFRSLWRIHERYLSLARGEMPKAPRCNAPWHSAVVEPDGAVRPCFFHPAYGRLDGRSFESLLNDEPARTFRRGLDVASNPVCRHCVCWKHLGARESLRVSIKA